MSEDRLREALRAEAASVEPSAGAYARLEARLDRGPRLRSTVVVGIAVVLVAVLVAGVVALVRDPARREPVGPRPDGMPRRILGITDHRQPVVLDSRTGRVLARYESHSVERGTQVAVAPDGRDFYVVDGDSTGPCGNHSILRLGLAPDGRSGDGVAAPSTAPAVSPDGRYLAYLRCRPGDTELSQIVLRDLALGSERATDAPDVLWYSAPLVFDADSRHVIVGIGSDNARLRSNLTRVDLVGAGEPGEPVGVGRGTLLGALPEPGTYLSMLPARRIPHSTRLGDVVGPLGPSGGGSYFPVSFGGWFGLPSPVQSAAADPSGRHVAAVSRSTLYRWSRGDDHPVRLRRGIRTATWIPDPVPRRRAVVAVTTQYQLERIDPRTGTRTSLPGGEVKAGSIAVDPGSARVVAAAGVSTCTPQLISVSLTGQEPAVVVVAAQGDEPTITQDGRYLAYLRLRTDCHGGKAIVRRDLATGAEVEFPAPAGTAYLGLRWLPNGRDVLTRRVPEGPELPAPDGRERIDVVGEPVRRLRIVGDPVLDGPSVEVQDQGYVVLAEGAVIAGGCGRGRVCEYRDVNAMSDGRMLSLRAPWPGRYLRVVAIDDGERDFLLIPRTTLYTWRRGETRPRKLATDMLAAAWFDAPATGR